MKKRILTLFVTFCLVLSMVVPSAFAADDSGALTYSFFDNTVTSGTTKYQKEEANKGEVSFTSDPAASYLNTSYSTGGVQLANSYFLAGFSKDRAVQDWCALKISDVVAGTYDMTFDLQNSNKAGVFTVFVVTENAYSTILNNGEKDFVSTLSTGGDLSQAQNKEILTALESVALNQVSEGKLDNGNLNDTPALQSIGKVTFAENGNYVIVFRCDGVSDNCATKNARLLLNSLTMTPVVAEEEEPVASSVLNGVTTNYTSADVLAEAINDAEEGTKFTLLADVTTATELTLKSGVTLDLNGKALTATVNAKNGIVTDTTGGKGSIVGSAIVNAGENAVALTKGNVSRVFGYTMTEDNTPVVDTVEEKKQVGFWFKVELSADAYTMLADGAAGLKIGAKMQWTPTGGEMVSKDYALGAEQIIGWAGVAGSGDYWFYVNVTGFESLTTTGSLAVVPMINDVTVGNPITYTVAAQ